MCLEIENGILKVLKLVSRQIPTKDQKGSVGSTEAQILEMSEAALVLVEQKSKLFFRNQPLNEIPVTLSLYHLGWVPISLTFPDNLWVTIVSMKGGKNA